MAKKSMLTEAQDTIVDAAKTGAAIVKPVATAALGAAAAAVAGVVLESVSKALKSGEQKVAKVAPGDATKALGIAARPAAKNTARKKAAAKRKKPTARKTPASKKKPAVKKKRASKKKTATKKAVKKKRAAGRRGR